MDLQFAYWHLNCTLLGGMQRTIFKRPVIIALAAFTLCFGFTEVTLAKTTNNQWPLSAFINDQTVLARYYQDYAKQYPVGSTTEQIHEFCILLLDSDLLAERLSMVGGKPSDLRSLLVELSEIDLSNINRLSKEDSTHLKRLLHSLDIQLENIDHSLSSGTRKEFRREVLADIPPLNRVG